AQVTELREPAEHRDTQYFERPGRGQRLLPRPAPAVAVLGTLAGLENGVGALPAASLEHGPPHGLRLGAVHEEPAETLKLAPMTTVDERVVGKASGGEHPQAGDRLGTRRMATARILSLRFAHWAFSSGIGPSRCATPYSQTPSSGRQTAVP